MYRLLVVDDETIIADGLHDVFAAFDPNLAVSKAYSGYEALEVMNRSRVDIVLSDIRMPGLDGLALMAQIHKEWPHCKIIFLTGYDDFDYVYQAIQKPGVSYILKTEGYGRVKDKVREAMAELDRELQVKQMELQSRKRQYTLETLLQSEYFRHLVKGSRGIGELAADFGKLNIPLDADKPVTVVLAALGLAAREHSHVDRQAAALTVITLADSFLREHVRLIGVPDRYQDVLWLIQPKEDGADRTALTRLLEGTFDWIGQACQEAAGVTLAVTLANAPVSWHQLSRTYELVRQLKDDRVVDGAYMVQSVTLPVPDMEADGADKADHRGSVRRRTYLEEAELLDIHLESGRREEFFNVMENLVSHLGDEPSPAQAMEGYYAVALVLLAHGNRLAARGRGPDHRLLGFDDHPSWRDGFAYLRQIAEELFARRQSSDKKRAEQAIDRIRAHIEAHLHEDLSLIRLAGQVHFNPSYLSRMFKQAAGITLSEYIDESRVKKAKELLKDHELKIAEVGARVGYDAPHSFTRFFKKMTGMTPQEYRDGTG